MTFYALVGTTFLLELKIKVKYLSKLGTFFYHKGYRLLAPRNNLMHNFFEISYNGVKFNCCLIGQKSFFFFLEASKI